MTYADATRNVVTGLLVFVTLAPSTLMIGAFAQNYSGDAESGAQSVTNYTTSYEVKAADVTSPVTIVAENHVYYPGGQVRVTGFVWMEIVDRIESLDAITIEAKDGQGNIIARENASIASDGKYATTLALLDSANSGTYTVQAKIELEADALGLIEALTSATLQSSAEFVVAKPVAYKVTAEDQEFEVQLASNSGINAVQFNQQDKKLSFFAEGNDGTAGVTEITIPKVLLSGNLTVFVDQNLVDSDQVLLKSDTATATVLEVNYHHSIHRVEVAGTAAVPELPVTTAILAVTVGGIVVMSTLVRHRLNHGISSSV